MILAALDLGSRHVGAVCSTEQGALIAADTIDVPERAGDDGRPRPDVVAACSAILAWLVRHHVSVCAIEIGRFFATIDKGPGAVAAQGNAHGWMRAISEMVQAEAGKLGIRCVEVPRQRWAAWLCGNAARGDADVRAALARYYQPADLALLGDTHTRDAAGVLAYATRADAEREAEEARRAEDRSKMKGARKPRAPRVRAEGERKPAPPRSEASKERARERERARWRAAENARRVARGEAPVDYEGQPRRCARRGWRKALG